MKKELRVGLVLSLTCLAPFVKYTHAAVGNAGIPILWDTAWILPLANQTTVDHYLTARAEEGFDLVMMNISGWGGANTVLGNGQKLFLSDRINGTTAYGDTDQPNPDGFAYIDHIVQKAQSLGLTIGILPMGNGSSSAYIFFLENATRAHAYGRYLGDRYKGYSNIIWVLGGDVGGIATYPQIPMLTTAFKDGLQSTGSVQKISFHAAGEDSSGGFSSRWFPPHGQWLDFDMAQIWAGQDPAPLIRPKVSLGKPIGLGEGGYEGEWPVTTVRAGTYQTFLAGGSYVAFGQIVKTPLGGTCCGGPYTNSATPGAVQSVIAKNLMISRGWQGYSPDESFVSSFNGSKTAAIKGNAAAMIYLSTIVSTVTVDMSRLNASGNVQVTRFNPVDGSATTVGIYAASGNQTFDTGGLADAVILFDAVSPPTPSPPEAKIWLSSST